MTPAGEPRPPPGAVLFDLDGTLVDTAADIARALAHTLAALGRSPPGECAVRRWIGRGVGPLLERALREPVDAPAHRSTRALFEAYYRRTSGDRSTPYPGASDALAALAGAGIPLGIVTNKPEAFTRPLLDATGLARWFAIVVSGDTLPRGKPDPLPLLHAARALGSRAADTWMVGDSVNDVRAARAAGMPVICVSYGYNHGDPIEACGPDLVIDTLAVLPRLAGLPD